MKIQHLRLASLVSSLLATLGLISLAFELENQHHVHTFYYLWYGNPTIDGTYKHWNHEVLPHWEQRINERFQDVIGKRHEPPGSIHSPFYPQLGPYSSKDPSVITARFQEMARVGIDVAVVSWWGQESNKESTDTQGVSTDAIFSNLLDILDDKQLSVKVALHLEPYPSRNVQSIRDDVEYIYKKYGHHKSLFRSDGKLLFYVYDSYHIRAHEWSTILQPGGVKSLRGTEFDGIFIGLWLHHQDGRDLLSGGFDGVYSYFASAGFSYGSNPENWRIMCSFCKANNLLCNLSVGPGYIDEGIRPWNGHNTKGRANGAYYEQMWRTAIVSDASMISITSWNEWGEGTQIEPAAAASSIEEFLSNTHRDLESAKRKIYLTYPGDDPFFFTNKTREYTLEFRNPDTKLRYLFPRAQNTDDKQQASKRNDVKIRRVNGILEYL